MTGSEINSYDEIVYPSAPYPYTHPDHLAVLARLFGMNPARVDAARVLEIGCADGANLIPLALALPGSRFEGCDLSARQISIGRETISQLALTNIQLHQTDLAAFRPGVDDVGHYDYIIAQGVLSWTPPDVQQALLALCRRLLSPDGVAIISYNVLPGWRRRLAIREWLLSATTDALTNAARVSKARRLIELLRSTLAAVDATSAHNGELFGLKQEVDRLAGWSDGYLCHDLLECHNEPMTFRTFLDRVADHRLRYMADADFASMAGADLPPKMAQAIQKMAKDRLECEQVMDLVSGRAFRQSLVCRSETYLVEQIDTAAIEPLYIASPLRRDEAVESGLSVRFRAPSGFVLHVDDPGITAALDFLAQAWPAGGKFSELVEVANSAVMRQGDARPDDAPPRERLAATLLAGFAERAVELHTLGPAFSQAPGEFPRASPLARLQTARSATVTNLRHDLIELAPNECRLLALLDGKHHRHSLAQLLGPSPMSPQSEMAADRSMVDRILTRLARKALLLPNDRTGRQSNC